MGRAYAPGWRRLSRRSLVVIQEASAPRTPPNPAGASPRRVPIEKPTPESLVIPLVMAVIDDSFERPSKVALGRALGCETILRIGLAVPADVMPGWPNERIDGAPPVDSGHRLYRRQRLGGLLNYLRSGSVMRRNGGFDASAHRWDITPFVNLQKHGFSTSPGSRGPRTIRIGGRCHPVRESRARRGATCRQAAAPRSCSRRAVP